VKPLCRAVGLSRASYYRSLKAPAPAATTMALRDELQKIALEFPAYGYRRITPGAAPARVSRESHAVIANEFFTSSKENCDGTVCGLGRLSERNSDLCR